MASRTDINHPQLGNLAYEEDLDWYSGSLPVDGQTAGLKVHCHGAEGEPPALPQAVRIASEIQRFAAAAKDRAVRDLLALKNDSWRDADEAAVSAEEFKRLMRLEDVVVYGNGRAEFYHSDGDLFWGHCILVLMETDGSFKDAHIAG